MNAMRVKETKSQTARGRLLAAVFAVLVMACFGSTAAFGQCNTSWIGPASGGVWNTAGNWNSGVPISSTNACIDNGKAQSSAVTLNISGAQVKNLTIDSDDSLSFNLNTNLTVNGSSINNGGQIVINGGSGTNSILLIGNNLTLQGGGTLTLNTISSPAGGNAFIQAAGTNFTLTNVNNTIQGEGIIGNGSLGLINQATINANSTGANSQALSLTLNGSQGVTNTGLLEATNSGVLVIANTVNNSGGTITANGSAAAVVLANGSSIQGGTLNTLNGGTMETAGGNTNVTLDGSANGALTLSKGSTYTSPLNTQTVILGTINNNGNFLLQGGSGTNTEMTLAANTTLQGAGGGTVTLSTISSPAGGNAFIQGNGLKLTNANNVIQGEGIIGNGSLTLANAGTIDANSTGGGLITTLSLNGGNVTNTGLLEATNSGVLVISNTVNNSGGTITANGSSAAVVLANGSSIQGGTLNTLNGGTMETAGGNTNVTLDGSTNGALTLSKGSTYTSPLNTQTVILGTINNNGNFLLQGGSGTNTEMTLAANTTLQGAGGGTVTLSTISSPAGGSAFIQGNSLTLTNTNNIIQGAGVIGNGSLTLVNGAKGTLFANAPGQTLLLNGSGAITNNGTLQVASGSAMHLLNGPFTNFASSTLTGGTYNVSGTLEIDELGSTGGEIVTNAANIILTGTGSSFIDAGGKDVLSSFATNAAAGSFSITGGRNFTTSGNFTNNGSLTVGSGSKFAVPTGKSLTNFSGTTLTGGTYAVTGTLQFPNANIVTNAANITLSGSSSKIVDQTGTTDGLRNFATNAATGSFSLQGGRNFTTAGNFTNNGTLTVGSGDTFAVPTGKSLTNFSGTTLTGGKYAVTGTLQFPGANIVTNAANITLTGSSSKIVDQTGTTDGLRNFATNAAAGSFTIQGGRNLTTPGSFTNLGTLTIGNGSTFTTSSGVASITPSSGAATVLGTLSVAGGSTFIAGGLTNFASSTGALTGGTFSVAGTLQFNGANIVTNAANITLSGSSSKIVDQTGTTNGLRNFATNAATGSFSLQSGRNFTTAGNFTNNGTLTVGSGDTFAVPTGKSLTNFSGTTLTGGTYAVTGTLQFPNANIVTNAANITLTGTSSQIINQTSTNGLANFATNAAAGVFSLQAGRTFTTAGNFSNAGTFTIGSTSTFTVGGTGTMFTQTAGTTTDDGTLTLPSSGTLSLQAGSLFGNGVITGAVTSSGGTIRPGDSSTATGILKDTGLYTQNSTGTLDISIDGTTAGTQYDQLNPTMASLNGTLNISRPTGFVPAIGATFKIMNFSSETGKFSTVNGLAINSSEHFQITYPGTDVLLTVVSGPCPPPCSAPLAPSSLGQFNASSTVGPNYSAAEPGRMSFGLYGRGSLNDLPHPSSRLSAIDPFALATINQVARGADSLRIHAAGRDTPMFSHSFQRNIASSGWLGTVRVRDMGALPPSSQPMYSSSKLQTSPRADLGSGAISLAKLASLELVGRRNELNRSAIAAFRPARNFSTGSADLGSGAISLAKHASLELVGRRNELNRSAIAAFRPARNFSTGMVPHSFLRADANRAIHNRINPAAGAFPRNTGMVGRHSLEYHVDLLSILGTSPRHLLGGLLRQPGSPNANNFGYLTFSGSH